MIVTQIAASTNLSRDIYHNVSNSTRPHDKRIFEKNIYIDIYSLQS